MSIATSVSATVWSTSTHEKKVINLSEMDGDQPVFESIESFKWERYGDTVTPEEFVELCEDNLLL